ncbi:restriction endonuclease subunit S [Salmonella enterica subsp. enterica serovar Chester]|uniref:restriction endonuclease subunit S n=1 Tax=Salmonella enterica TaxID=28901 RepID=UPI003314EF0F
MSGGKLPEGWVVTNLQNIANWGSGGTPSRSHDEYYNGNIPWIKTGDLGPKLITEASEYITDAGVKNSSAKYFPKGSVAIAMYGATIGKTSILGIDATTNQACAVGTPIKDITSSIFLYYFLLNEKNTFIKKGKGGAQPNISQAVIKEHPLSLPPYAEQKIITEKLDTLLAQVDSTKARLEQIPQILKRFRQSILTCAIDGTLTSKWRETVSPAKVDIVSVSDEMYQNGITYGNFGKKTERANFISLDELSTVIKHVENWPLIRIGSLCDCIVPNRDKPKTFSGGFHWLLTQNFDDKSIWIDYSKISLGLSKDEVKKYNARIVNKGSVIMTCIGRLGLSAVLEEDSVINQQLHAFIPNKYIKAEYLAYCIRANQNYFKKKSTSTTIDYLNKTACNSLPIPLPSLEEQHEIVRRVEQLFAYADTIEKQVNSALTRVNSLTQSILAKAFRGELTAQWRAENPDLISGENSAAALLEKIKAERAASGGKKTSRKKA